MSLTEEEIESIVDRVIAKLDAQRKKQELRVGGTVQYQDMTGTVKKLWYGDGSNPSLVTHVDVERRDIHGRSISDSWRVVDLKW